MTITRLILQKCDRCKDERDLPIMNGNERPDNGGWREVKTGKHLCPNCIHVILEEADGR